MVEQVHVATGAHACCEGNDILTEIGRSAEAARRAARERAGQAAKLATDDIDKGERRVQKPRRARQVI